jgi:eukaryotic-like serine/threonine-protein kinase
MQDVNLVLADRYQARERLGSGAGAGVEEYLGRDLRLARPVVIQVIRGPGKDGFAPQARLMASLDHPAVASVYDWGQQHGLAYLIREYVPGQDLGRLLLERGTLPVAQAAAIGAEVAAALAAAHRIGLAHGSLDAADVILGDQRVTVVGFGAAWMRKAAGKPERPGGPAGADGPGVPGATEAPDRPGPPERPGPPGRPEAPDPDLQADLSALGAMLHQMVTATSPEQWPVVTPVAGGGPELSLRQVIGRLMAPEQGDRYHAAEAVRADLLHLTHQPTASMRSAAPAQPPQPARPAGPAAGAGALPAGRPSWVSGAEAEPGTAHQAGPPARRDPRDRRRRRRTRVWLGAVLGLALLGGAVAGALVLTRDTGERATIRTPSSPGPTTSETTSGSPGLPDVVGLDRQAATRLLEGDGFVASISEQPSERSPGLVTGQRPGAGQRPPKGAIVFLTVSSGPGASTVPTARSPGGSRAPPTTAAQASP